MIATRAELHWTVLLVPIPMILLVVFSLGVGLVLSAITVKVQGYYAFVYSFYNGITIYDTCDLSDVHSSVMVI